LRPQVVEVDLEHPNLEDLVEVLLVVLPVEVQTLVVRQVVHRLL
jgi:hypothetical protein